MSQLLFIHGFATGPEIWQQQTKEFGQVTDLESADNLIIVGWSMGCWKALELALEYHHKVKGLVLVSGFAKYVKGDDYPYGTPLALLKKLEKRFLADYKQGMTYFYDLIFKDKTNHHLIDQLPKPEKADLEKWFSRLEHEDLRPHLPRINIPTLIIHGDQDPIVSGQSAEYLRKNIKNSRLIVFHRTGHAPFLEQAEEFNRLLKNFIHER